MRPITLCAPEAPRTACARTFRFFFKAPLPKRRERAKKPLFVEKKRVENPDTKRGPRFRGRAFRVFPHERARIRRGTRRVRASSRGSGPGTRFRRSTVPRRLSGSPPPRTTCGRARLARDGRASHARERERERTRLRETRFEITYVGLADVMEEKSASSARVLSSTHDGLSQQTLDGHLTDSQRTTHEGLCARLFFLRVVWRLERERERRALMRERESERAFGVRLRLRRSGGRVLHDDEAALLRAVAASV